MRADRRTFRSELRDVDAAIARGDLQQQSAAIQLATNARALDGPVYGYRHVQLDLAVTSVGIKLGSKVLRKSSFYPAVTGMNQPSVVHLRTRPHGEIDMSIAGA